VVRTSTDILEGLLRPPSGDDAIDRKALASLLIEIAESLKPELRAERNGVIPSDLQLEQLRTLLVGREIETLSRLTGVVDDPERLAAAIGRVLPTAIAQATSDARMGHVLAPVMEKAAESSIRSDPSTLVNILYPTIVPAIRKSIGETIDETFQRLNETLKYSLTWRGLQWRWEAWRLIAHVAAENAVSQDPQLVSSMLVAIQDFVRDSFSGAEHQGLDSVRLGELRLWSEPGPFAALVAVIRGDPPEGLHDTMRNTLSRIHAERQHALESFDGDSAGLGDRGAAARTGAWRARAAKHQPRTRGHSGLAGAPSDHRGGMGGVVVAQPTALGELSGPATGATRNCDHRSGQARRQVRGIRLARSARRRPAGGTTRGGGESRLGCRELDPLSGA
jgi:OOP family OmpA-OmpF porin